jgi:hypothetical protein
MNSAIYSVLEREKLYHVIAGSDIENGIYFHFFSLCYWERGKKGLWEPWEINVLALILRKTKFLAPFVNRLISDKRHISCPVRYIWFVPRYICSSGVWEIFFSTPPPLRMWPSSDNKGVWFWTERGAAWNSCITSFVMVYARGTTQKWSSYTWCVRTWEWYLGEGLYRWCIGGEKKRNKM